jgi:hypothetical protein
MLAGTPSAGSALDSGTPAASMARAWQVVIIIGLCLFQQGVGVGFSLDRRAVVLSQKVETPCLPVDAQHSRRPDLPRVG